MAANFKSPPIDEVVCGVRFAPLPGIRLPHYGLLWEALRAEYPSVKHAPPLAGPPGLAVDEETGGPLPRVWYVSEAEDFLVQLQPDFFAFNWRRRGGNYPRFDVVFPKFLEAFGIWREIVGKHQLGDVLPVSYELSYVNNIARGSGWQSAGELQALFPDIAWRQSPRFLPSPNTLSWSAVFQLPENKGILSVSSKIGKRKDSGTEVIVLDMTARTESVDKAFDNLSEWFLLAHDWIVKGFCDVTSTEVQERIWGRDA